jgi:polyhydroxyalkanoate synthesis regulator protein
MIEAMENIYDYYSDDAKEIVTDYLKQEIEQSFTEPQVRIWEN